MFIRGKIQNQQRAAQLFAFENLLYGKITPTDIDGCIEYKNKAYILFEFKYNYTELPRGQKIALQRMTDDLSKTKECVLLICSFDESMLNDCNEIKADETIVYLSRYNNQWQDIRHFNFTLKSAIDSFLSTIEKRV